MCDQINFNQLDRDAKFYSILKIISWIAIIIIVLIINFNQDLSILIGMILTFCVITMIFSWYNIEIGKIKRDAFNNFCK